LSAAILLPFRFFRYFQLAFLRMAGLQATVLRPTVPFSICRSSREPRFRVHTLEMHFESPTVFAVEYYMQLVTPTPKQE
jgi:hypothetical protein